MPEAESLSSTKQAVASALEAHSAELRRFVSTRVRPNEVDDVLQAAALRAVERCETLADPALALAWLYRIHRNLIIDTRRKRASNERWMYGVAEPPEVISAPPLADELCDCSVAQARRLNPAYATVLALVDLQGASLSEAAEFLGITVNNATVRLHRARSALRKAMREHCGVESARDCVDCRCVDEGCCAT